MEVAYLVPTIVLTAIAVFSGFDSEQFQILHKCGWRGKMKHSHSILMGVGLMTLLSLVVTRTTPAQDVVKASPDTHKVILENEHVRVLDVHAKPGEKVAMHSHPPCRIANSHRRDRDC